MIKFQSAATFSTANSIQRKLLKYCDHCEDAPWANVWAPWANVFRL